MRHDRTDCEGGATEVPIYFLADYARGRSRAGNVPAYGIAYLTSEFAGPV